MTTPNHPNQVNRIWENVDKWWHDAGLQAVRRSYEKYACRKSGIIQRFAGVLKEALGSH